MDDLAELLGAAAAAESYRSQDADCRLVICVGANLKKRVTRDERLTADRRMRGICLEFDEMLRKRFGRADNVVRCVPRSVAVAATGPLQSGTRLKLNTAP